MEENLYLLKLAVQEKYDAQDLILLTKMEISIPLKTQDLKHHMRNIAGLAGRCFGDNSLIYQKLQEVEKHIEQKENSYTHKFRKEKLFGGHFLDKIHWRIH